MTQCQSHLHAATADLPTVILVAAQQYSLKLPTTTGSHLRVMAHLVLQAAVHAGAAACPLR